MTSPTLEPPPTADDLLVGRANLLGRVARYIACWELPYIDLGIDHEGVHYQTDDHKAAAAVAAGFNAVPQDDRRTSVNGGWVWAYESWASDVLTVSWCKRLEVAK